VGDAGLPGTSGHRRDPSSLTSTTAENPSCELCCSWLRLASLHAQNSLVAHHTSRKGDDCSLRRVRYNATRWDGYCGMR
jgi:hypothetical protein